MAVAQDDLVAMCEATLEAEGGKAEGCSCLVEKISDDPALFEEFISLGALSDMNERYEAASSDAKAVIDECKLR